MDKFDGIITRFHNFYPTGYVVSVFRDSDDAQHAATELQTAGFFDVRLFTPQEVAERYNADLPKESRLDEFFIEASDASAVTNLYLDYVRQGQTFVLVKAHESGDVAQAKSVFEQHHGHTMYQYNRFTFQPLA